MAKLQVIKRLLREDIKEAPGWIVKILDNMNRGFESLYLAMEGGISFQDNITCQIKEIKFKTNATYPALPGTIQLEGSTVSASNIITNIDTHKVGKGMTVSGTGIPLGAVVDSILSPSSLKLSINATASGLVTLSLATSLPPFNELSFNRTFFNKAFGCTVEQIYLTDSISTPITKPVSIHWIDVNGLITINHITGLEAGKSYTLRLLLK